MAEILVLCWVSDRFIAVILDSSGLKVDSPCLFFFTVVNFFYLSDQGHPHIKYKDIFMLFLDL